MSEKKKQNHHIFCVPVQCAVHTWAMSPSFNSSYLVYSIVLFRSLLSVYCVRFFLLRRLFLATRLTKKFVKDLKDSQKERKKSFFLFFSYCVYLFLSFISFDFVSVYLCCYFPDFVHMHRSDLKKKNISMWWQCNANALRYSNKYTITVYAQHI